MGLPKPKLAPVFVQLKAYQFDPHEPYMVVGGAGLEPMPMLNVYQKFLNKKYDVQYVAINTGDGYAARRVYSSYKGYAVKMPSESGYPFQRVWHQLDLKRKVTIPSGRPFIAMTDGIDATQLMVQGTTRPDNLKEGVAYSEAYSRDDQIDAMRWAAQNQTSSMTATTSTLQSKYEKTQSELIIKQLKAELNKTPGVVVSSDSDVTIDSNYNAADDSVTLRATHKPSGKFVKAKIDPIDAVGVTHNWFGPSSDGNF